MKHVHLTLTGRLALSLSLIICLTAHAAPAKKPAQATGLDQAMRLTLVNNPDIRSKREALKAQGYRISEARSGRLPTAGISYQPWQSDDNDQGILQLSQPIYTFGKIQGAIDLETQRHASVQKSLLSTMREKIEETAVVYTRLHGARQRLAVSEQNVAEHQRLLDMISRRSEGGVASDADERLASSRMIDARAQHTRIQTEVRQLQDDLYALTQRYLDAELPVNPALAEIPIESQLLKTLLNQDANVQRFLEEVRVVEAERDLSRSRLMPSISARYEYDLHEQETFDPDYDRQRIGIVADVQVEGLGFTGYNRVKGDAQRIEVARANLDNERVNVRRRAKNLLTERDSQRQLRSAWNQSVRALEETQSSFLRQYDAGRKGWIDVLNTQRELSSSRQEYQQANTAWLEASLRLAAQSGRLDRPAGLFQE
jgi:adhesin transport system outer membrane protein